MYAKYFKRLFDFFGAIVVFVAISPLLFVLYLLVSIKLGRPSIFKQSRLGFHERPFFIYKFKSMTDARDETGKLLPDALRLTRFGEILRRTSFDELPQLINIIKGEMSFIGPRPLLAENLPFYTQRERRRHEVRPGITGLAQINGRNMISNHDKFEFDIKYVEDITFIGDVRILIVTVFKVLRCADINVAQNSATLLKERVSATSQKSQSQRHS